MVARGELLQRKAILVLFEVARQAVERRTDRGADVHLRSHRQCGNPGLGGLGLVVNASEVRVGALERVRALEKTVVAVVQRAGREMRVGILKRGVRQGRRRLRGHGRWDVVFGLGVELEWPIAVQTAVTSSRILG